MPAWWRTANGLAVGHTYLATNPLLEEPLTLAHIKPRLLGHWRTTPGLKLLYLHPSRLLQEHDLDMINVIGPGQSGPRRVVNAYLEDTDTKTYPDTSRDRDGERTLFRQFSWPGGIPSPVAPATPGSIHESSDLGYSLAHAYGAAFSNVGCIVLGRGENEQQVRAWLVTAAGAPGFIGFAVGRTTF